jgi:hypothetical protein
MGHITPTFAEEFHIDHDPKMVALDFWSYINARQANLGWSERDHRMWWHLEQALVEVKPVLLDPQADRFAPFLAALAEEWRSAQRVPAAPPGAQEEAREVRRELADMLTGALGDSGGDAGAASRPVVTGAGA